LAVVQDAAMREKQGINWMTFLARNNAGLKEMYELVSRSTEPDHFYYIPRIDSADLAQVSENLIILCGAYPQLVRLPKRKFMYAEVSPVSSMMSLTVAEQNKLPLVAVSDNFYPTPADSLVYEVISGRSRVQRTTPMHLLTDEEWFLQHVTAELTPKQHKECFSNQLKIVDLCDAELPKATLVHFSNMPSLESMCRKAATKRNINLKDKVYAARLKRELDLIAEKQFEDYFYLVADLIAYAKQHMLVGPARGSSCGSLVCYLLSITEVDPIPYDLLFERFIDVNRKDLPDIDIDFPDDRRDMVFDYITNKYGADCVARLGTVMRAQAKSAIGDVAKELGIPQWEVADLKGAIIERSTGDSRAAFCIMDTFEQLDIGKAVLAKYPQLRIAADFENHARGSGKHAAGIVVTAEPVSTYCSVDKFKGTAQVDKADAESLNLLKIDALGLRTLSVLQDCLDQVGWSREKLIQYPTNDEEAYAVLNSEKFSGIFQFEGYALQSLCKQLTVESFEDIASLTALARPGPLNSGGATEFLRRRVGEHEVVHLHPLIAHTTQVTYGVVIYQEQVMQIAREMGKLSWEDVSSLRKAMSKSLGKEFFDSFWVRFRLGALSQGVKEEDAQRVWDNINTMGSWSFNRSHAVAYGLVSYWCMVMKAKYPLQFAAACVRNAQDDDQVIKLLRELKREGFSYKVYDAELSEKNWTVKDGVLIGGLLNIKGVGEKMASDIVARRAAGQALTTGQRNKLANAMTPFDHVFECEERWGHIKREPRKHGISSPLREVDTITKDDDGELCFIAKLAEKNLRDLNELANIQKRGGKRMAGQALFLNMTLEDDSGPILATIDRHNYLKLGKPLIEEAKIGDWFVWKGVNRKGFRKIYVKRWRKLS
jgi:DNA-directed DNA polymerase III PolC